MIKLIELNFDFLSGQGALRNRRLKQDHSNITNRQKKKTKQNKTKQNKNLFFIIYKLRHVTLKNNNFI
jgi:hypothetical protein